MDALHAQITQEPRTTTPDVLLTYVDHGKHSNQMDHALEIHITTTTATFMDITPITTHQVIPVTLIDTKPLAMPDKEDLVMELTALTAQPIQELTLQTQHVHQLHALVTMLSLSLMELANIVTLERSQMQPEEAALFQEHTTDILPVIITQVAI